MNKNRQIIMTNYSQLVRTIIIIIVVSIGAYFFTKGTTYPSQFKIIENTTKIRTDKIQDFTGAMLVNLDEDSDLEIFIAGHGNSSLFLKRIKDEYYPMEIPELSNPLGLTFSITACDLDKDGRDEILVLNHPNSSNNLSNSRILKFNQGRWIDLLTANDPITTSLKSGYSSTCIDRKGDGKYGLAVTNENGKISYLELEESSIIDVANEIGIALKSKGRSILGIPSPRGPTNIFVGNEDGANFFFENKGDGTFTEKADSVGVSDHLFNARGISIIDLNNDEIPDIVYGNNLGPTRLLEQTREGKFLDVTPEIMKVAYAVNSPVVGDFNLDGYEDLFLNNIRGYNKVFTHFDKNWYEIDSGILAEKEMFGVSTIAADLDKNGSYDILNTHGDGSHFPLTLYSIESSNQWIKFSAKYKNGSTLRGATIILRTNKRDQVRVISTGSGRFANYDDNVIFGLIKNEEVISSEIILPSGVRVEYKGGLNLMRNNEFIIPLP
jgi:hypothetical protein